MKKYIVVQKNDLCVSVSHQFDTLDDAVAYRDIMSRNVETLKSGKPMWEYFVYNLV